MNRLLYILPLSLLLAWPAFAKAAAEDEFMVMKACHVNATAMNLQGLVREHYLNTCVISQAYLDKPAEQVRKQCQINATAMNLDGNTRRHYLASCLASN
ncbi:hypothetical protein LG198_08725 [Methylobacillus arboreus]|uniref:hypothetical protein n=1 Tax=Methylobacillus arboreus TaxID=755170 RepID=UPI001E64A5E0|nr:hypothetical protein [Methylobacillus arboreus]MCB5190807.1 hypothetical protein [Methylobacillus arboreus]